MGGRGTDRAWFKTCGLEAARLASWVREERYRGMVVDVYGMRGSEDINLAGGIGGPRRQQCQLGYIRDKESRDQDQTP